MKRIVSISALLATVLCLSTTQAYSVPQSITDRFGVSFLEEDGEYTPATLTSVQTTGFEDEFDGESHTITIDLGSEAEGATILYGETDGSYTLTEAPSYTNVGEYTIYFQVSKEGYVDYTNSAIVKIKKKAISLTANAANKHAGQADPTLSYSITSGSVVSNYDLQEIQISRAIGEDPQTYSISITVDESANPNYAINTEGNTFTIEDHHFAEDFTILKEATCTQEGEQAKQCTFEGCNVYGEHETIDATNHTWGATIIVIPPTCTTEGTSKRICSICQNVDIIIKQAMGHVYAEEYTIDIEPTCEKEGEKSLHCHNCEARDEEHIVTIPALGHQWDEGTVVTAATCTTNGSKSFHCTNKNCEETKNEVIEQLGHDFAEEFTIDLTESCTTVGSKSKHCQRDNCDAQTEETDIPATGHQWNGPTTSQEPTCTNQGKQVYTCAKCSETKEEDILALGHSFAEEYTIDINATCETAGSKSFHCTHSGCEEKNGMVSIEALGHDMVKGSIVKQPTCTEEGEEEYKCSRCDQTDLHTIEALGHEYAAEYTVDKNASCQEDGLESRHCIHENCTAKVDERIIAKGEHLWGEDIVVIAPDCKTAGKSKHICEACGASEDFTVKELGHDFSAGYTIDKDATCETMGTKSMICARCKAKTGVTLIPAKGHIEGEVKREDIVEATCTTNGSYNEVQYCERCDKALSTTPKTTAKLGHEYQESEGFIKEPECESQGIKHSVCVHCGDIKTEMVEALGHAFADEFTEDKAPSCLEEGSKSKHCTRCNIAKTDIKTIAPLGHNWDEGDTTLAPTCTTQGSFTQTCDRCSTTDETVLEALGHEFADKYTIDIEATCQKKGQKSRHCNRCDEKKDTKTIAMVDHVGGEPEKMDVTPATCLTGEHYTEVIKCSMCETILSKKEVDGELATGHKWNEGVEIVTATCTEGGRKTFTCTACGAIDTKNIEAYGHNYDETFTIDTPVTCTTDGLQSKHCTRCDIHGFESVIPATGHIEGTPVKENEKEPKCIQKGSYDMVTYCSACNVTLNRETIAIDSLGHTWNEGIETKKPTCVENGILSQTCKICMMMQTSAIKALGHDLEERFTIDQEATCHNEGSQSKHCKRCEFMDNVTVIPALPHQWDEGVVSIDPTCTTEGEKSFTCEICGDNKIEELEALGHKFSKTATIDTVATCTTNGIQSKHCERCDAIKDVVTIPALGHDFEDEFTIDTMATCETNGRRSYHCTRCDETNLSEIILATGHDWDEGTITVYPTEETLGEMTHHCQNSNCDDIKLDILDKLVALLPNEEGKIFDVKAEGYCKGENEFIGFTSDPSAGKPNEFKMVFSEEARQQGFEDLDWTMVPSDEKIEFNIPADCQEGNYTATITFRNEDTLQSAAIEIPFTINLSEEFTVAIFRDVISVVNDGVRKFETYQWYHNDEIIEGATLPYYQEKGGLSGNYYVVVNEGTENEFRTCTRNNFYNPLNKTRDIIISPNPVEEIAYIKLINFKEEAEHTITIYNEFGAVIYEGTFEGEESSISATQLVGGQYLINIDGLTAKMIKK